MVLKSTPASMAFLTKNKVIGSRLLVIAGRRTGDGALKAQLWWVKSGKLAGWWARVMACLALGASHF